MAQYIFGGYQSMDIILVDQATGQQIPHGVPPGGTLVSELDPDTDYDFFATIHNDATFEVNFGVHFWGYHGGIGANQASLDCVSGSLGPGASSVFQSTVPFLSAPVNQHRCAVVSLERGECGGGPDITELEVKGDGEKSQAAYRNTNSVLARDREFIIDLEGNWPGEGLQPDLMRIVIDTFHVPADWPTDPDVITRIKVMVSEGDTTIPAPPWPADYAFYLVPWLQTGLATDVIADLQVIPGPDGPPVDIVEETVEEYGQIKRAWTVFPTETPFVAPIQVIGTLPKVGTGDLILARVKALYDGAALRQQHEVEFTRIFIQP